MVNTFFTSDLHFFHKSIILWAKQYRPFDTVEEMNLKLIENFNKTISDNDKVFILGDVFVGECTDEDIINIIRQLKGNKTLIAGNHCTPRKIKLMQPYLQNVMSYKEIKCNGFDILASHVPIHEEQLQERFLLNIHGHMHDKIIMKKEFIGTTWDPSEIKHIPFYKDIPDERYFSVCVEQHNLTPVNFDIIMAHANKLYNDKKNQS